MSEMVAEQILRGVVAAADDYDKILADPKKVTKEQMVTAGRTLQERLTTARRFVAKRDEEEKRRVQAS